MERKHPAFFEVIWKGFTEGHTPILKIGRPSNPACPGPFEQRSAIQLRLLARIFLLDGKNPFGARNGR
jgi:hypothetical protein